MKTCSRRLGTPSTQQGCWAEVRANFDVLNLGLVLYQSQGLFHDMQEVNRYLALVRRGVGKTQKVFNDRAGPPDAAVDLFGALAAELRVEILFRKELSGRGRNRQRRSDFMGYPSSHHAERSQLLRFQDLQFELALFCQVPAD